MNQISSPLGIPRDSGRSKFALSRDPTKRAVTLMERGLDFARANEVFAGPHLDRPDQRQDYGEPRVITFGWLEGRMVVIVWTPRDTGRRIISIRKANDREYVTYHQHLG